MTLSKEQISQLSNPIDPNRVAKDNDGYSHVEIWDVRRTMTQIFGFGGWSQEIEVMELVHEGTRTSKAGKENFYVVYRAKSRVHIHATNAVYSEWAAGASSHPVLGDAHDLAMKTAESQATKRACINLGDQFGLSLYRGGSTEAVVGETLTQEFDDAERVPVWANAMEIAESIDDLNATALLIKGSDISSADRNMLLGVYKASAKRLNTA